MESLSTSLVATNNAF
jgi:hypothetical protein